MFTKIVQWLFSATPVLQVSERKDETRIEKMVSVVETLMTDPRLGKETLKPDSKIYPVHMYTTSVRNLIDIVKALYYKVFSVEVYVPISGNRVMIDLGNYLNLNGRSVDTTMLLENMLVILKEYGGKKALSYREKFVLEDIDGLLDVFCFLVDHKKETNGTDL